MDHYFTILVFALAGFTFPLINVLVSKLLRRDYPDPAKLTTYESGETPFGDARVRFHIHYYIFALIFVLFDILTVFMYPWAVVVATTDILNVFTGMAVFVLMLGIALLYAYKKKVLVWV